MENKIIEELNEQVRFHKSYLNKYNAENSEYFKAFIDGILFAQDIVESHKNNGKILEQEKHNTSYIKNKEEVEKTIEKPGLVNKIIWKFDIFIYSLFYWRWRRKLEERQDIRKLFLDYLNSWEAVHKEPAMGVGSPPNLKVPLIISK